MGRLAAKGFDQTSDINYQETYTHIHDELNSFLFSLIHLIGKSLQPYVKSVYLHIDLEEEVYIGDRLGFPFS